MNFQVPYKTGYSITSPAFLKTHYHVLGESVTGNLWVTDGLEGRWENAHIAYFNTLAAKHIIHSVKDMNSLISLYIHFISSNSKMQ